MGSEVIRAESQVTLELGLTVTEAEGDSEAGRGRLPEEQRPDCVHPDGAGLDMGSLIVLGLWGQRGRWIGWKEHT